MIISREQGSQVPGNLETDDVPRTEKNKKAGHPKNAWMPGHSKLMISGKNGSREPRNSPEKSWTSEKSQAPGISEKL